MNKKFYARVFNEKIVDTRNYRYTYVQTPSKCTIIRLPIMLLGTTRALDGWEPVKIIWTSKNGWVI